MSELEFSHKTATDVLDHATVIALRERIRDEKPSRFRFSTSTYYRLRKLISKLMESGPHGGIPLVDKGIPEEHFLFCGVPIVCDYEKRCKLCGDVLDGAYYTITCSSMGKEWDETYCEHCYEMESLSMGPPCADGCRKCNEIIIRDRP